MGYKKSVAKIRINDTIIDYETYNFDWSYTAKDDSTPNFLQLEIPNLSKKFRESISKNDTVIFEFGFDNDTGTIIQGYIDQKTFRRDDVVTNYTVLNVIDVDSNVFTEISKTYKNKNTEYIIKDIASALGLTVSSLSLGTNTSHVNGYVAYGKGINIIKQLVEKNGSKLKLEGDILYIYEEDNEEVTNPILFNFETGLLSEPSEYQEDGKEYTHVLKSLANHKITKDSVIRIESEDLKSYARILKYDLSNWTANYYIKLLEV